VNLLSYDLKRTLEPNDFRLSTTTKLQSHTWLQVDKGERIFLLEYQPPGKDGLGAKFIFPRTINGAPVIKPGDGSLQFFSELSPKLQLKCDFIIRTLEYEGKLEY